MCAYKPAVFTSLSLWCSMFLPSHWTLRMYWDVLNKKHKMCDNHAERHSVIVVTNSLPCRHVLISWLEKLQSLDVRQSFLKRMRRWDLNRWRRLRAKWRQRRVFHHTGGTSWKGLAFLKMKSRNLRNPNTGCNTFHLVLEMTWQH